MAVITQISERPSLADSEQARPWFWSAVACSFRVTSPGCPSKVIQVSEQVLLRLFVCQSGRDNTPQTIVHAATLCSCCPWRTRGSLVPCPPSGLVHSYSPLLAMTDPTCPRTDRDGDGACAVRDKTRDDLDGVSVLARVQEDPIDGELHLRIESRMCEWCA